MGLFKKAEEVKSGAKVLAFGKTGVGKSLFLLSFPEVGAIDSEDGLAFYQGKYPNLKFIAKTTSAEDVEEALEEIEDEYIDTIQTFGVDSETKIYENMQHGALGIAERRAKKKGQSVDDANISQREWGKIKLVNKRIQSSKIKLSSMGKNIVSIAQEKDIKEKKGDNWIVVGHAPDTAKGFEFDYDVVLRLYLTDEKGKEITVTEADENSKYMAKILKDRTQVFKVGTIIENPSYNYWKEVIEGKSSLKESIVDFKSDINKDENAMETELEAVEKISLKISNFIKENKEDTSKLKPLLLKAKEFGLTNPSKVKELKHAKVLLEIIE